MPESDFAKFSGALTRRLQRPLPGRDAQLKMSSLVRIQELLRLTPSDDARLSSVLILFYPFAGKIWFTLIQRPDYKGVHGGQISLPGGKSEDTDESLIFTALREAQEEIGIIPAQVQIAGTLTEMYIPPSNFIVTPVVGFQMNRPEFRADPTEVAEIIEIKLDDLLDDTRVTRKKMRLVAGITLKVPAFYIDGHVIWGATAMILSELKEIICGMVERTEGSERWEY